MYRLRIKLVCLSQLVSLQLTIEKTLAYYEICKCSVNYESLMFDSTGPWVTSPYGPRRVYTLQLSWPLLRAVLAEKFANVTKPSGSFTRESNFALGLRIRIERKIIQFSKTHWLNAKSASEIGRVNESLNRKLINFNESI